MTIRVYVLLAICVAVSQVNAGPIQNMWGGGEDFCYMRNDQLRCLGTNTYAKHGVGSVQPQGLSSDTWGSNTLPLDLGDDGTGNQTKIKDFCIKEEAACALTTENRVRCWGLQGTGWASNNPTNIFDGLQCTTGPCTAWQTPWLELPSLAPATPKKMVCGGRTMGMLYTDGTLVGWGSQAAVGPWYPGGGFGPSYVGDQPNEMGNNLKTSRDSNQYFTDNVCRSRNMMCGELKNNGSVLCWVNFDLINNNYYLSYSFGSITKGEFLVTGLPAGRTLSSIACADGYSPTLTSRETTTIDPQFGFPIPSGIKESPGPYAAVLLDDGSVWTWGSNELGQLGLGYVHGSPQIFMNASRVDLPKPARVLRMSSETLRTCVVFTDGTLSCWGFNEAGELGVNFPVGEVLGVSPAHMGSNLPVIDLGQNRTVVDVVLGVGHTCALLDDDQIKCWGANNGVMGPFAQDAGEGGLGMGDQLCAIDTGNYEVLKVSNTNVHTCALVSYDTSSTAGNRVKCWGANDAGQLGVPANQPLSRGTKPFQMGNKNPVLDFGPGKVPVDVVVSANLVFIDTQNRRPYGNTGVVFADGTVRLLGDFSVLKTNNHEMSSGYGNITNRRVTADRQIHIDLGTGFHATRLLALPTVSMASGKPTGGWCATTGRRIKCWGESYNNLLGQSSSVDVGHENGTMGDALPDALTLPSTGPNAATVSQWCVASGSGPGSAVVVLLSNGTLVGWGSSGTLLLQGGGGGGSAARILKLNYTTYTVQELACGASVVCVRVQASHAKDNRTNVVCWGETSQLGSESVFQTTYGNTGGNSPPVLQLPITPTRECTKLSMGNFNGQEHLCMAFKNTPELLCVGPSNSDGQLGTGSTGDGAFSQGEVYLSTSASKSPTPSVRLGYGCRTTALWAGLGPCAMCSGRLVCFGVGKFGRRGTGSTVNAGRTLSSMGEGLDAVQLFECQAGMVSGSTLGACTCCGTGTYRSGAITPTPSLTCDSCPTGTFSVRNSQANVSTCDPCPPGRFQSTVGSTECTPCAAGSVSEAPGASACTACPAGTFSDRLGLSACVPCAPGTFGTSTGAQQCQPCGPGTAAEGVGNSVCATCPAGKFAPAGASNCTLCAAGTFQSATAQAECSVCPENTYSTPGLPACLPCPRGANCSAGTYNGPLQGWWHANTAAGQVPKQFYQCPFPESCLRGSNSTCLEGYEGQLCALCKPGYHKSSSGCVRCASSGSVFTTVVGVLLLILTLAIAIYSLYQSFKNADDNALDQAQGDMAAGKEDGDTKKQGGGSGAGDAGKKAGKSFGAAVQEFLKHAKVMTKLKIVVSFGQILSSFNTSMDIEWPSALSEFYGYFSSFNFQILEIFSIDCAVQQNYYGNMIAVSLAPIVLGVIGGLVYLIMRVALRNKVNRNEELDDEARNNVLRKFTDKFVKGGLFLLFLVYPGVSSTIVKTFRCQNVDGTNYLVADYSLSCDDPEYATMAAYAGLMTLVYPIGIPVIFFFILYRNRDNLRDPAFEARFGFLYAGYEPKAWYYELTELLRKLVLTSVLIFVAPGSTSQVAVGMFICFVALLVHVYLQPFVGDTEDNLQFGALTQLFLCLFAGLLIKAGVTEDEGYDKVLLGAFLIFLNTLVIVMTIVLMFWTLLANGMFKKMRNKVKPATDDDEHIELAVQGGAKEQEQEQPARATDKPMPQMPAVSSPAAASNNNSNNSNNSNNEEEEEEIAAA